MLDHSILSLKVGTLQVFPRQRGLGHVHLPMDSTGLKLCASGERLLEKHGTRARSAWRKLHIEADADTGQIVAAMLSTSDVDDASQVSSLLDQAGPVTSFTADGAYDHNAVHSKVARHSPAAAVIVPPRSSAMPSNTARTAPTQRDHYLQVISEHGRTRWQRALSYDRRALLVETAITRFTRVIGDRLRSRTDRRRGTEIALAVSVLNPMLELGRPEYIRLV